MCHTTQRTSHPQLSQVAELVDAIAYVCCSGKRKIQTLVSGLAIKRSTRTGSNPVLTTKYSYNKYMG